MENEVIKMAMKLVEGKEIRVPGGAVPEGQCRQGALGRLDGMGWRAFQRMPQCEKLALLSNARAEMGNIDKAISTASKGLVITSESDIHYVTASERYLYRDNAWAGIALALAKEGKFEEALKMSRKQVFTGYRKGKTLAGVAVEMSRFGATTLQLKPIFDEAISAASHTDEHGQFPYAAIAHIAIDMARAGLSGEAIETVRSISEPGLGYLREEALKAIVVALVEKIRGGGLD